MFRIADRWVPNATLAGRLVAVGWLDPPHQIVPGEIAPPVRAQLGAFVTAQGHAFLPFRGVHTCGFCMAALPADLSLRDAVRQLPPGSHSGAVVFVPTAEGTVYVVQALVLHYIDTHGYQPPAGFCAAVLACPPLGSPTCFRWLEGSGRGAPDAGAAVQRGAPPDGQTR